MVYAKHIIIIIKVMLHEYLNSIIEFECANNKKQDDCLLDVLCEKLNMLDMRISKLQEKKEY